MTLLPVNEDPWLGRKGQKSSVVRSFSVNGRIMERAEILNQVAMELAHIPSWPGEHQGWLRYVYRQLRTNSLRGHIGVRDSEGAGEVLQRSVAVLLRDFPSAQVEYDEEYFDG